MDGKRRGGYGRYWKGRKGKGREGKRDEGKGSEEEKIRRIVFLSTCSRSLCSSSSLS